MPMDVASNDLKSIVVCLYCDAQNHVYDVSLATSVALYPYTRRAAPVPLRDLCLAKSVSMVQSYFSVHY